MNTIHKIINHHMLLLAMLLFVSVFSLTSRAYADSKVVDRSISSFGRTSIKEDCTDDNLDSSNCDIIKYLVILINTLSAIAGIIIIGSIVYAGIQYSMSGSDPQKVGAAKDRIRNAIIALVFFLFGVAILNYIVPGGLL